MADKIKIFSFKLMIKLLRVTCKDRCVVEPSFQFAIGCLRFIRFVVNGSLFIHNERKMPQT